MNPSFWSPPSTAPTPAGAPGPAGPAGGAAPQEDCSACSHCPVDDWLIPCSSPDCTLPQTAACTDQCLVVTHHAADGPCSADCDGADATPCDLTCDGFDTNWVCDGGAACSVFDPFSKSSFPQLQQGLFPHNTNTNFDPMQAQFSPFFFPANANASPADFSHCLDPSQCSIAGPALFSQQQQQHQGMHQHQQQQQQRHYHQQQQQQQHYLPLAAPIQIPQQYTHHHHSPSTSSSTTTNVQTPSTSTSYHGSPSPMLMQQQQVAQSDKPCLWSDCQAVFPSTDDLFAHLSATHIPVAEQPAAQMPSSFPTSCLWDDCHIFPNLPSLAADTGPDAIANFLTTHLLQDHLGLLRPPFPETTAHDLSPVLRNTTSVVDTTDDDSNNTAAKTAAASTPQVIALSPYNEPRTLAVANSEAHACLWIGCNDVFPTCDALTQHIAAAHVGSGKAQYECQWRGCSRTGAQPFASKQKILRHMQSHTGHRPFQCSVCKQNFSEAATLQQHMRRHTHEKPYVCDFPGCGKAFAITGALTIHKRIHNGEKPFKCTYCDRAFSESSNLSKHLRTHTGARPYACPEPGCDKRFARPDQVSRHMNVHRKAIKVEASA